MSDHERREPPDYSELLRSPYDPDPKREKRSEGSSALSWKGPVIAAILGALIVSVFVVYAASIRSSEGAAEPVEDTTTTTTVAEPVASDSFPVGFGQVTNEVGARVEAVDVSSRGTVLAVTTAVRGGLDAATVAPLDVAYWELSLGGSTTETMVAQSDQIGAVGNIAVEFAPLATVRQPVLVAYPAEGQRSITSTSEYDATVPRSVTDLVVDLGDGARVVVQSLDIGDGWGWVEWTVEGDVPARVDVVVTFVGTDDPLTDLAVDPTRLVSPHLRTLGQGTGINPLPPLYGFSGGQQLVRDGEPLSGTNAPEAVTVELIVYRPDGIGDPVEIEVPPSP